MAEGGQDNRRLPRVGNGSVDPTLRNDLDSQISNSKQIDKKVNENTQKINQVEQKHNAFVRTTYNFLEKVQGSIQSLRLDIGQIDKKVNLNTQKINQVEQRHNTFVRITYNFLENVQGSIQSLRLDIEQIQKNLNLSVDKKVNENTRKINQVEQRRNAFVRTTSNFRENVQGSIQSLRLDVGQIQQNLNLSIAKTPATDAQGLVPNSIQPVTQDQTSIPAQSSIEANSDALGERISSLEIQVTELKSSLQQNVNSINERIAVAQQQASSGIANVQSSFNERLSAFGAGLQSSIQQISATSVQNRNSIAENSQQLNNNEQLNALQQSFTSSISAVQKANLTNRTDVLRLTDSIREFQEKQLFIQEKREAALNQRLLNEKRAKQEGLLEGVRKGLSNVGKTVAATAGGLGLGGLLGNLKNALKLLAGGFVLSNWDDIWQWMQENGDLLKRTASLWFKNFLTPFKRFVNIITDGLFFLAKKSWQLLSGSFDLLKKVVGFGWDRVLKPITKFLGKLLNATKRVLGRLFRIPVQPPPTNRPNSTATGAAADAAADSVTNRAAADAATGAATDAATDTVANRAATAALNPPGNRVSPGANMPGNPRTASAAVQPQSTTTSRGRNRRGSGVRGRTEGGGKKWIAKQWSKITDFFKPVSRKVESLSTEVGSAAKKGPEAVGEVVSKRMNPLIGALEGAMKKASPVLNIIAGPLKALGNTLGADGVAKFLSKGARSAPIVTFPVDFLLNKYLMGQDDRQALIRAIFSTAGSFLGAGLVGASTGGLGLFAGGLVGGEIGDYVGASLFGYDTKDTSVQLIAENFPKVLDWLQGKGTDTEGNKVDISPSPSQVLSNDSSSNTSSASTLSSNESISAPATMASKVNSNDLLRRPTKTSGGASNTSGNNGGINMNSMTLPPMSMNLDGASMPMSRPTSQSDASPIPDFSSRNPLMDMYEMLAAKNYEMELV